MTMTLAGDVRRGQKPTGQVKVDSALTVKLTPF